MVTVAYPVKLPSLVNDWVKVTASISSWAAVFPVSRWSCCVARPGTSTALRATLEEMSVPDGAVGPAWAASWPTSWTIGEHNCPKLVNTISWRHLVLLENTFRRQNSSIHDYDNKHYGLIFNENVSSFSYSDYKCIYCIHIVNAITWHTTLYCKKRKIQGNLT